MHCILLMQRVCSSLMWIIRARGRWRTALSAIWPQDWHCCILPGGWSLWAYPDSAVRRGASGPVTHGLWSHIRKLVTQFTAVTPANPFTSMRKSYFVTQNYIYLGSRRPLGLKQKAFKEITLTLRNKVFRDLFRWIFKYSVCSSV